MFVLVLSFVIVAFSCFPSSFYFSFSFILFLCLVCIALLTLLVFLFVLLLFFLLLYCLLLFLLVLLTHLFFIRAVPISCCFHSRPKRSRSKPRPQRWTCRTGPSATQCATLPKDILACLLPICERSFAKQMVVDALLSLLVRAQEYNFVVRSGVFEFPIAGRITAGYRRTFISDLGSRFRFERNAPTGTPPSEGAMCQAAQDYHVEKQPRGRPAGCKKTTKAEDKTLMDTFKKLRPPGHGLTSRTLHKALPKKLSMKITPRTCRRRLAEKGYKPEQKMSKADPGVQARPTYQKHPTHTPPLYNSWAAPLQ